MVDTESTHLKPADPWLATSQRHIALWVDVMDTAEQFLLAGLRRKIGPHGDLKSAYRDWYDRQMQDHDQMMTHMIEEFNRWSANNGR